MRRAAEQEAKLLYPAQTRGDLPQLLLGPVVLRFTGVAAQAWAKAATRWAPGVARRRRLKAGTTAAGPGAAVAGAKAAGDAAAVGNEALKEAAAGIGPVEAGRGAKLA